MRRSTVIVMIILVVGFGGLLLAAQGMLKPLAKDAELAKELTSMLQGRGDLAEGTRVRAVRVAGGEKRLAPSGTGLLLDLTPSARVREQPKGLSALATRIAREALQRHTATNLRWVEVTFFVEGTEGVRTLVAVGPEGNLLPPAPPLPEPSRRPAPAPPAPVSGAGDGLPASVPAR
jgi:hypothetical protein